MATKAKKPARKAWKAPNLTLAAIMATGPCEGGVKPFKRRFGNGGPVTMENIRVAIRAKINFTYAGMELLRGKQKAIYTLLTPYISMEDPVRRDERFGWAFYVAWHTKP